MKILLSALGWIDDAPRGNRLRWHYPVGDITPDGTYRGLPKVIVIERAPFDFPDVFMAGFVAPGSYTLPKPVQAIRFEYQGSPARIVIRDSTNDVVVYDRLVVNGE